MSEISQLALLTSMAATGAILGAESPDAPYGALYTPAAIGAAISLSIPQSVGSVDTLRTITPAKGKYANLLSYYSGGAGGGGLFFGAAQSQFNATITGSAATVRTLTITSDPTEPVYPGMIISGSGVAAATYILMQQSGQPGGQGTYVVSTTTNVTSSTLITAKFVDDGGLILVPTGGDGSVAWVRSLVSTAMMFGEYWGIKANFTDDDSTAAQNALNAMIPLGGHLVFPKGKCKFENQVTINRWPTYPGAPATWPASGGSPLEFYGVRDLTITGYGCEIHTVGAISGFDLRSQSSYSKLSIRGFYFYHRANTTALAGIRAYGTHLLSIEDNHFLMSSSLPATYAGILFETVSVGVDDGSIVSRIDNNSFSNLGSQDGDAPYGIALYGSQNGVVISRNSFSAAKKHIYISNYPGLSAAANATYIVGNSFEGPQADGVAITLNQDGASVYHVNGTTIIGNRLERLAAFVSLEGPATNTAIQTPTYLAGNIGLPSVGTYIKNPYNIPINSFDATGVGMPTGTEKQYNNAGWDMEAQPPAPITFTGSITDDILTVTAGTGITPGLVLSGTGITTNTILLYQEASNAVGNAWGTTGTYKVSISHAGTDSQIITGTAVPPYIFRFHRVDSVGNNYGFSFRRTGANRLVELATFNWRDFSTGTDRYQMLWSGVTYKLGFANVGSISSTSTPARNFRGSVAAAGAGPFTVTFPTGQDEANATYQVIVDVPTNVTAYVDNKSTTGFRINVSGSVTGTIFWTLIR